MAVDSAAADGSVDGTWTTLALTTSLPQILGQPEKG